METCEKLDVKRFSQAIKKQKAIPQGNLFGRRFFFFPCTWSRTISLPQNKIGAHGVVLNVCSENINQKSFWGRCATMKETEL